jgi:dTDP-L-rhamnose 4-epimerase
MLALENPQTNGQVINIGSGVARCIRDCAQSLAKLLGLGHIEPQISGRFRKGDIRHCIADISKARRVLGYEPQIAWEMGLAELINWARTVPTSDLFDEAERELKLWKLVQ